MLNGILDSPGEMKKMGKLKENFEAAVDAYIEEFEKKQGIEFEGWVGGRFGEIAYFGVHCISMDDIRLDIDTNQPKSEILKWIDYKSIGGGMNYISWVKQNQLI